MTFFTTLTNRPHEDWIMTTAKKTEKPRKTQGMKAGNSTADAGAAAPTDPQAPQKPRKAPKGPKTDPAAKPEPKPVKAPGKAAKADPEAKLVWKTKTETNETAGGDMMVWTTKCGRYRAERMAVGDLIYFGASYLTEEGCWWACETNGGPTRPRHYDTLVEAILAAEAYHCKGKSLQTVDSNREAVLAQAGDLARGTRVSEPTPEPKAARAPRKAAKAAPPADPDEPAASPPGAAQAHQNGSGRGTLFGHSLTSILRALGRKGWKSTKAQAVLAKMGHTPSMNTIRSQIGAGNQQTRGEPAVLTEAQWAELDRHAEGI